MKKLFLVSAIFLSGCGDDPQTEVAKCRQAMADDPDKTQLCMDAKGYDYRYEDAQQCPVAMPVEKMLGGCYELRGTLRSAKLLFLFKR